MLTIKMVFVILIISYLCILETKYFCMSNYVEIHGGDEEGHIEADVSVVTILSEDWGS